MRTKFSSKIVNNNKKEHSERKGVSLQRDQFKQNRSSSSNGELYRVLYDFTAKSPTEVSVKAGDVITVTDKAGDGWFTMATQDDAKKVSRGYIRV